MPVLQSDNCYQTNIYLKSHTTDLVPSPFLNIIILAENCRCGVEGNSNRIVNGNDVTVNRIRGAIKTI